MGRIWTVRSEGTCEDQVAMVLEEHEVLMAGLKRLLDGIGDRPGRLPRCTRAWDAQNTIVTPQPSAADHREARAGIR